VKQRNKESIINNRFFPFGPKKAKEKISKAAKTPAAIARVEAPKREPEDDMIPLTKGELLR